MRVLCLGNRSSDLPSSVRALEAYQLMDTEFGLETGKSYVVYAMDHVAGRCLDLLVDPGGVLSAPAEMFRLVDGRMSRYWVYSQERIPRLGLATDVTLSLWGYPEYVESNDYRMGLIDGREEDLKVFRAYRDAMDLEFPAPAVEVAAVAIDEQWIQCPSCSDAWESVSRDGMVKCPSCSAVVLNPRYADRWPTMPA